MVYIIVKFSFILLYFFQNFIENPITRFKNNVNQYKDIGCAWDVFSFEFINIGPDLERRLLDLRFIYS
jgi:hypothetical protein